MRTKENTRKQVRKQDHRIFKVFGILALTVAALVATSIIGPSSRNGRVFADNPFSQLNVSTQTYTTRTLVSNQYVIDPGTVPGTISLAAYVPPANGENGYRGAVDPCISIYALDCSHNATLPCTGNNPSVACTTTTVLDSSLGDQNGISGTAALDHRWVQGEDDQALIYQLPATSTNAIVFPSIDHAAAIYEAVEFTVWGLPAGNPLVPFVANAPAPWVEGRLVRVFKDGWNPHPAGAPYCQSFSFTGEQHETDDYASVWSFRDATNNLVAVSHVAILAGFSVRITPEPPAATTMDSINCFTEQINGSVGSGYYTSHDNEIDAVGISSSITGCIEGVDCPPTNLCTYTQGKFNAKSKNAVATYLQNNFSILFPSGLTIGKVDGSGPLHNATWTNVSALRTWIGGGGTAGLLTADTLNATSNSTTGGGVLASQVAALTINLALSGSGGGQPAGLGNVTICHTGTNLDGLSVQTILNQANCFLAGDTVNYTLGLNSSSLSALINNLNLSFDDCVQSMWGQSFLCSQAQP